MDRLLEHPELFIIIAGVLSYLIKRRKVAADAASRKASQQQGGRAAMELENRRAEEAERARKIREEMLRRRSQRASSPDAAAQTPVPQVESPQIEQPPALSVPRRSIEAPPPVYRSPTMDPLADVMKEIARRFQPDDEADADKKAAEAAEAQKRIKLLEARIAVLERDKAAAQVRSKGGEPIMPIAAPEQAFTWDVRELANPANLRRAIVLNEVLGRPVGLR